MKHLGLVLLLVLAACGRKPAAGGGVVVGNGLSGDTTKEFYSRIWNMGFEYSDEYVLEESDGRVIIDNRLSKASDEPLSSLVFSPVDAAGRKIRTRSELIAFVKESEKLTFEKLPFAIGGGSGIFHETQGTYEDGSASKVVYFYFLTGDFKIYKAKLQEPKSAGNGEEIVLTAIIQSLYYDAGEINPDLRHFVESEDEGPDA